MKFSWTRSAVSFVVLLGLAGALYVVFSGKEALDSPLQAAPPAAATAERETPAADLQTYAQVVQPFLRAHCLDCHGADKPQGDLRLDTLLADFNTVRSAGQWIEVMDKLNLGEMPPQEEPQPKIEELTAVTRWIAAELRQAERRQRSAGGRVVLRRMNRAEYANTIRDLLSVQFLPGESPLDLLPPDGTAEGFDKVSSALTLDPSLLEKYFEVAQQVARAAVVDGPPPFETQVMRYELEETANNRAIQYLCSASGIHCREQDIMLMQGSTRSFGVMKYPGSNKEIPVKGMYRIRVRAWGEKGADGEPVVMRFHQNHPSANQQLLLQTEVTDQPKIYEVVVPRDPQCGEYNVSLVNGYAFQTTSRTGSQIRREQQEAGEANDFERVLRLQSRQQMEALTWTMPNPDTSDISKLRKLYVDWIECEGPLYDQWPPRSHQQLLFAGDNARQEHEYVQAIFKRFMQRAFRRPVTTNEVDRVAGLVASEIQAGETFNNAVRAGLIAVLCSPKFLYIAEASTNEGPRPLNDWELASRLSYFLWSSMPDQKLFDLAAAGQLRDAQVLQQQVDRMLDDERSEGFVQGFAAQWLRTGDFGAFLPDTRLYKEYDEALGKAMVGETLAFFREVLDHDLNAMAFMDSDWTMVNERLARFYGIEGVEGDAFRRVALPADSPRGGLLGMAGVALLGSDGNRTKPVHRGIYVREVFFNDPPDPPPPNAGEVEPNIQGKNLTVRERLIQHQQIASCAACHKGIDGYGLAMENFNAIGAWRTQQDGENFRGSSAPPIDPSGVLPNGKAFATFEEFKLLLQEQQERFARGLSEKMLTYALGRPIEPTDRALIDRLAGQLQSDNFTLRRLIAGVVVSEAFLSK
ncbi:DUF1592 domain-containing protein [Lignipirellula cremea]|uniref:Planctomycete cytochrome C n=1 Tax=Lignipirellula cremea TaxID=2528010 RepID=A0A518E2T2_9BACT|nr:DUF1592 domain-containing protein [Lignipirellula cremea]QDU98395.1 Planctomycete cytochrome C [Lignipirellula cremea]